MGPEWLCHVIGHAWDFIYNTGHRDRDGVWVYRYECTRCGERTVRR